MRLTWLLVLVLVMIICLQLAESSGSNSSRSRKKSKSTSSRTKSRTKSTSSKSPTSTSSSSPSPKPAPAPRPAPAPSPVVRRRRRKNPSNCVPVCRNTYSWQNNVNNCFLSQYTRLEPCTKAFCLVIKGPYGYKSLCGTKNMRNQQNCYAYVKPRCDYSQIVLKVFKLTCLNHWLEELTEEEAKHEYKVPYDDLHLYYAGNSRCDQCRQK